MAMHPVFNPVEMGSIPIGRSLMRFSITDILVVTLLAAITFFLYNMTGGMGMPWRARIFALIMPWVVWIFYLTDEKRNLNG